MIQLIKTCSYCKIEKPVSDFRENRTHRSDMYVAYCRLCSKFVQRRYALAAKHKIVNHYSNGTNTCRCCGENNIDFLSIDHIVNGKGNPKTEVKSGYNLYIQLIKDNYPEGYQILCYNCNQCKGYFGICSHQKENINRIIPCLDL